MDALTTFTSPMISALILFAGVFGQYCVLRRLCEPEFKDFFGRDLYGSAGLGVPAHAGGALHKNHLADPGQGERVLCLLVGEGSQLGSKKAKWQATIRAT